METKKEIRDRILKLRQEVSFTDAMLETEKLSGKIFGHPAYLKCSTLFSYVAFRNEMDTRLIIDAALEEGKQVAVPRVEGKVMNFYKIHSLGELVKSSYGILEPPMEAHPVTPGRDDLMLVPGVVFDRSGYRIGYGGGYYDKYLENYPDLYTIGLAYDFQILEGLPVEAHDLAVREVIVPD